MSLEDNLRVITRADRFKPENERVSIFSAERESFRDYLKKDPVTKSINRKRGRTI